MQALNAGTQAIQQRPGRPSGSTLVRVIMRHLLAYFGTKVNESASWHTLINRVRRAPRLPEDLGRGDNEESEFRTCSLHVSRRRGQNFS